MVIQGNAFLRKTVHFYVSSPFKEGESTCLHTIRTSFLITSELQKSGNILTKFIWPMWI